MSLLEERLQAEMQWRLQELAFLKSVMVSSKLGEQEKKVIGKYFIVSIYALWEGFVKDAFKVYINVLNEGSLKPEDLSLNLLIDDLKIKYKELENAPSKPDKFNFEYHSSLIKKMREYLEKVSLSDSVKSHNGELAFGDINKILRKFCLKELSTNKFKTRMEQLTKDRNSIAHGDFRDLDNKDIINEISQSCSLVEDLMSEVLLRIVEGFSKKTYLIEA